MTRKIIRALFTLVLVTIMTTSLAATVLPANALTQSMIDNSHTTASYGSSKVCGDHMCAPGEHTTMLQALNDAQRNTSSGNTKAVTPPSTTQGQGMTQQMPAITPPTQGMTQQMPTSTPTWVTKTGTLTSVQDPGQGHESHQLAIVLPPSDKIYSGVISWTSSQPMQVVQLTGPLGSNDSKGQPIWTTDGKTKFALTLVNVNKTTGSFAFTGNALAFHLPQPTPFTVSYAVSYMVSSSSDTVKTGTLTSIQDPGQGHESHQLALILPPSPKTYSGILSYSASEPVQLVSLIGPIDPSDKKGQLVYTMDGKTWYALVFVEPGTQMGTWKFVGNAIAVHTKNTTPFQVSYTVDAHN